MHQRTIDLAQLFTYSFRTFKKYASFIIGIMMTYYVLGIVPQVYFMLAAPETPTLNSQLFSLVLTFIQLYLAVGFIKIMLLLIDDRHTEVADLFNNFHLFLSYFIASVLYGLGVLIGLLLLVIPGIFLAIRLQFYPYFIIEQKDSALVSLKKSFNLSQNLSLELLLFGIAVIVLNALGLLFMGIGIVFTYPLTTMATAVIYKGLIAKADSIPTGPYK